MRARFARGADECVRPYVIFALRRLLIHREIKSLGHLRLFFRQPKSAIPHLLFDPQGGLYG